VVSSERLIDELWGDRAPDRAAETLRVFVSRLRKAIRAAAGDAAVVVSHPPGYRLAIDEAGVDAARFESLVARGRSEAGEGRAARPRPCGPTRICGTGWPRSSASLRARLSPGWKAPSCATTPISSSAPVRLPRHPRGSATT